MLELVAMPFSKGSSQPRIEPRFNPTLQVDSLPADLPGKPTVRAYIYIYSDTTEATEHAHMHTRFVAKSCLTLLWSYQLEPTRVLFPWDFPSKTTGVGCHCLL